MSPSPLRLIALHDSVNDALALASQLRNAGIQANVRYAEDLPQLHELLREDELDLILHLLELPEPRLADVTAAAQGHAPAIPVVGMTASYSVEALLDSIKAGARDLIDLSHPAHVLHVIQRETGAMDCVRRLKRFEGMYQESEKRCHALMESSRDAIAYVHGGMHVFANPVYLETFGFDRLEDLEGSPLLDLVQAEDQPRIREYMRGHSDANPAGKLEGVKFKRRDGRVLAAAIELSPATIEGEPCTQVMIRTQADTQALEEQINFLSQRDLLTGLYNRQYFLSRLEGALQQAREGQSSALIHIQITNVPELKGKLGVAGLDVLITDAGKLIEKLVGPEMLLSRYSAHAFALLLPLDGGQEAPETFALRLLAGLTQHIFDVGGQSATLQAAAGIALLDQDTPNVNELLNRAERATLDAEAKTTERVATYTPKEGEVSQSEQDEQWSRMLRNALRSNRFRLLYQPMLSLGGDTSRQRYEAFLRLLDEENRPISPSEFMAAAERTQISHALDRWVILHALQAITEARQRGLNVQLFVRLSARSIADPEFPGWLGERLMAMQVHDGSLALEMSEKVAIEHLKQVKDLQRQLGALNCPLLLDGFGLGDDPFRILNYIEVQWLKLDRGLMESFATHKVNQAKVRELIKAIKQRGSGQLVVANVENAMTLQIVLGDGADFVQGNFIQAPVERLDFDFSAF
ncbi:MAG: EAL domain-containing protein [Pseudomonadota bacterium]|jgi:PAS domain S-box-containing protein/diguanylate cyclase (GGDEF)-like protein